MRQLSQLHLQLLILDNEQNQLPIKYGDIRDLFSRKNLSYLFLAIKNLSLDQNGKLKPGFKINTKYLLLKTAKIMKILYQFNDNDKDADEIQKFIELLQVTEADVFGDAVYHLNKNRNVNLRRPQNLPLDSDIKKLRNYIISSMNTITQKSLFTTSDFIFLRDLVVSRLTIFNARRGGEPCRLLLQDWEDAKNEVWVNQQAALNMKTKEKEILRKLRLTYQTGKGNNHLVPIIFPKDTYESIDILFCQENRRHVNILEGNNYLFPTLQGGKYHVQGWHAVDKICNEAKLERKDLLTATRNRPRISSLFASIDIGPKDRVYLFSHMGHSKAINENIYQSPAVIKELSIVGQRLIDIDKKHEETSELDLSDLSDSADDQPFNIDEKSFDVNESSFNADEPLLSNEDCNNKISVIEEKKNKQRHKWSVKEANAVLEYFKNYLNGTAEKSLPGRKDIMKFKEIYPNILIPWNVIHTRVMNEKRKIQLHQENTV